jgi:two-component system, NtrC family, sensor histidine kinase HydH
VNSRLTVRLAAPLLLLSVLLLGVAVAAAWYLQQLQRSISDILAIDVASMRAAEELEIALRETHSQLDLFLFTGDRKYLDELPALRREIDCWFAEARRVATTEYEQQRMARADEGYRHFSAELDAVERGPTPDAPERLRLREVIDGVLTDEILAPVHEYLDFNEEQVAKGAAENQRTADRTAVGLLLLGVCGPAAGLFVGLIMARRVNRSLLRLSLPIRDAAGKLNEVVGPVVLAPGWGLEELEAVLGRMAAQIGTVIARMEQSQRDALRAEQLAALGQLAAGLAHELRNPLMAMKILVQSAAARGDGAGLRGRGLAVMEEEITRLERLTSTLLDYARPPRPEKRALDLGPLVEETLDLVSGQAGRKDVRLSCDLPGRPVWIEADPGQLRQVVLNLLLNALDAAPEGGEVRVRIEGGSPSAGGDWLALRVEDDGPGLPTGEAPDLFAPFVSTKETGVGLGLPICKRIVEDHGGAVGAANRPGGGAVFTVRLPRRPTPAAEPAPAAA